MILQSAELSPSQKTAIEEILGRQLLERETVVLKAFPTPSREDRQAAAAGFRSFMEKMAESRPIVSDEEMEAAMLEAIRSERPNYRPVQ
jgi:hypothetical protein